MEVKVPTPLTKEAFIKDFGAGALRHYEERLRQRQAEGKVYYNPLKTAYIWAYRDKQTGQGYFSTLFIRGMNSRKRKNFGRS